MGTVVVLVGQVRPIEGRPLRLTPPEAQTNSLSLLIHRLTGGADAGLMTNAPAEGALGKSLSGRDPIKEPLAKFLGDWVGGGDELPRGRAALKVICPHPELATNLVTLGVRQRNTNLTTLYHMILLIINHPSLKKVH